MSNRNRLFEVMQRLNPELNGTIRANNSDTISTVIIENDNPLPISGDVQHVQNLKSDALRKAQSRINTQREFNEAFEEWFNSLGVSTDEYNDRINITTSIKHITDVMKKNNIKF